MSNWGQEGSNNQWRGKVQQRWLEKHERSFSCGNLHAIDQMMRGPRCYILSGMPQTDQSHLVIVPSFSYTDLCIRPMYHVQSWSKLLLQNFRVDHMSGRPVGPVVSGTPHATRKKKNGCIKTFQISPTAEINSSNYSCRYIEPIHCKLSMFSSSHESCQEQGCATRLQSYYYVSIQNQVHALVFVDS
jgi:hypothetical protein